MLDKWHRLARHSSNSRKCCYRPVVTAKVRQGVLFFECKEILNPTTARKTAARALLRRHEANFTTAKAQSSKKTHATDSFRYRTFENSLSRLFDLDP